MRMFMKSRVTLKAATSLCFALTASHAYASSDTKSFQEAETIVNEVGVAETLEKEEKGQFPRLERQHTLGAIQRAWDKAPNQSGTYSIPYSQQEVIKLRLREFMTTTVVFPSWEKLDEIIIGDASTFEASQAKDNILLLKPKEFIGADSNITVIGKSGLVYTFYVRSEGFNSENLPDLRVHVHVPGTIPVSFPPKETEEKTGLGDPSKRESNPNDPYPQKLEPRLDKLNFKWTMSGDTSLAPQQVFSDGVRTWFNFGHTLEEQDLPVIARVIDGIDTPVNTRLEGTMIIAESVGIFTLRNGDRVVCAYPSDTKTA